MISLCFRSLSNIINENNLGALQSFLANKQIQVDDKDENGTTALMVACQNARHHMVSELLDHGADCNAEDNDSWTPLLLAAKAGKLSVCLNLLDHGAQIEHREMGGWSALMWASYKGHEDVVALLLERGADVNAHGNYHISSLIWAAGRGHSGIVDRLLAAGARANAGDKYGTTALIWAARRGDSASVRSLIAAGALPDQAGMYSWTALLQATQGNYIDIVQMLLELKPNVNALDKDGCTALTLACKEGSYEIAVCLINSGAYINIQDRGGDTCLIHAIKGGHRSVVEALLKKYADVDVLGKDRKTAVYNAVEKGHTGILKLLLHSNPDLELTTKDGDTALLRAVRSRNADMVQMLLDKKAKVNVADKRGDTCLHIAMRARSKAIVEILLRNPKNSQLLYRPNRAQETPYNIDMSYSKTILGQIFGARRLNTNDDNENMLGYELYSSALADMLSEPSLSMPITVGLYARWGSGKSFLLNRLREDMHNFARQWIELGWQWNWAVVWGLWRIAVAGGAIAHLAGASWGLSLASAALILALLYVILLGLWYASKKYEWSWPYTVMLALSHRFNSLYLVLQVVFCHPPGPQSSPSSSAQPIRFHFTDQAKSSTHEGEASVIQMLVSLSDALEGQYGRLCTRLYRAFRPKPMRATANWRWRRVCCIPNVIAFELCFLFAIFGICILVIYITDKNVEKQVLEGLLIGIGALLSLAVMANLRTLSSIVMAICFSPRAHIKRSVDRQPEGFLQALRPEVTLLTDMVKCLDAFTGQQTRLVVVVDALDSCEQDRVPIVLNAIHTLCSDQNNPFIIILAIDPHIISKAVEVNSKRAFSESNIGGWDYLKNMVQLPFYLQNSALRRVKVAQQTSQKKQQLVNVDDITSSLQRSVSARRLSSASEIMSSQEKLKGLGASASNSRSSRKLKISESVASSMQSNLHKVGLTTGPADLNRVLLTDDYFSDVNPRSMQRLMNVLYITGRLLKAFQIDFDWYHLAFWINLTEQWPFRTSWIIFHHEMYEEHIDDNTSLKSIYDKVRPNIPSLRVSEPFMELDRDERKLDVFLGFHRTSLLAADLKIFLPFTINLDPYLKKVIKDEQHQLNMDTEVAVNPMYPPKQQTSKFLGSRHKQHKVSTLPPIYGGMTPSGWPSWPEQPLQPMLSGPTQMTPYILSNFQGDISDVYLSRLSVSGICSLIERELPSAASSLTTILKQQNISGRVLRHCDLNDLKGVLNLNFGDWELFKLLILSLRELESGMPPNISITQVDKERADIEPKPRSVHESKKSKPSNMEKQVTLEEQMICGALQTLNEEAMEDVLLGEPSAAPVSDESEAVQLVLLTPSGGWKPTTPPASLTASPQMSRKSDPSILKSKGSFKRKSLKKHVSINDTKFKFGSNVNLKTLETSPIIVRIEDETVNTYPTAIDRHMSNIELDNGRLERNSSCKDFQNNIYKTDSEKSLKVVQPNYDNLKPENDCKPSNDQSLKRSTKPRPSSLLLSQDDERLDPNREQFTNRSKSAEDSSCQQESSKISNISTIIPSGELLNRLKEKIYSRSNSIERKDKESDDESTPLMSSERSSPSLSIKIHRHASNEDYSCRYSSPSSSNNSTNHNSSNSSTNENSPMKQTKKKHLQSTTVQKNLSPERHDCSDMTISVDFSPSPERSLSESRLCNVVHCDIVDNKLSSHSNEDIVGESRSHGSLNEISSFLLRTRSTNSVPYLLEPCSLSIISRGASDASIRSNFLWRQDAVDDDEDFNFPESSV
ncbi:ankyrin repeat-rich membrane spanning isoform X2 [Arctopsyche grandis]|uniref:ankyrin repeat-rich membrane spanning isoform X2 n=1 Tax=Arctopsyche grandis TaxID=121162 RepID=UPI00406D6586